MFGRKGDKGLISAGLMLLVAMLWGSSFTITKNTLDQMSPYLIMVFRFGIAALVMLPFVYKRLRKAAGRTWRVGLLVGLFAWVGHLLQLLGLQYIIAGESAFLSAVYVVLVPFIVWGLCGNKPVWSHILACALCFLGVGILSIDSNLTIGTGEVLTLLGGVGFALQIACVSLYASNCDMIVVTWITAAVSAVYSCPVLLLVHRQPVFLSAEGMLSLVYLAVVCTALAFSMQYVGMKYVPPTLATILLSTESVFGGLTGILFLKEIISNRMLIGCTLILASLLLCSVSGQLKKRYK